MLKSQRGEIDRAGIRRACTVFGISINVKMAPCCMIVDRFILEYKEKKWYWTVKEILKLLWHFVSLMIVLVVGAVCFWHIESAANGNDATAAATTATSDYVDETIDEHDFMEYISKKFQLTIPLEKGSDIYEEFKNHFKLSDKTKMDTSPPHVATTSFAEWFYFSGIVAMTIGM